MFNVGEEICGEYLKHILGCDFVSYNIQTIDVQGEIDVVGISLKDNTIYVCEVATHTGGLQYVKDQRPDNYNRFYSKFEKDIHYAKTYFNYEKVKPMLWSPIVRVANSQSVYNPYEELIRLQKNIKNDFKLDLDLIINEHFQLALNKLKDKAFNTSSAFTSRLMRTFQIETKLEKHINLLNKRKTA